MFMLRRKGVLIAGLVLAGLLHGRLAGACESDGDCKGNRVCISGRCTAPVQATTCNKDIDCSGEMICENNRCIAPMADTPSPVEPPSTTQAAPSPTPSPMSPRPGPMAGRPGAPKLLGPKKTYPDFHFGVGVGGAILNGSIGDLGSSLNFAGSFEADARAQLIEAFGLTMRVGGFVGSNSPIVYIAPGFYLPTWNWGLNVGLGLASNGGGSWLHGVWITMPYDYQITELFKIGVDLGFGIFPNGQTTLLMQGLSLHFGVTL